MFNNRWKAAWISLVLLFTFGEALASIDLIDEDADGFYGEAMTTPFKNAMDGTDALNARDQEFLAGVEENRVAERWYTRFVMGRAKVRLSEVVNQSTGPAATIAVTNPSASDTLFEYFLAGGHVWQHWAMELELFLAEPFRYYPSATGATISASNIKLEQQAVFLNVQYILPRWFDFYPRRLQIHLNAGLGAALKTTVIEATPTSGQEISHSTSLVNVVGNLGVGARYQLTPNFLIDIMYRYLDVGKTKAGPIALSPTATLILESQNLRSNGFFVGLTYQI